jgi:hypothetical protein
MLEEVKSEKLTERERTCVQHFRQAAEHGGSYAEYCRLNGLKANEWHAVKHGMMLKGVLPSGRRPASLSQKRMSPHVSEAQFRCPCCLEIDAKDIRKVSLCLVMSVQTTEMCTRQRSSPGR